MTPDAHAPQPPDAPLTLYRGTVIHQRMRPKPHRFSYAVYSVLVDLDRQHEIDGLSPLVSHNRWNLFSVHDKDHGPADGSPLRPWADRLLNEAGVRERPARLVLLCYPRILGTVFNPLSVYYAYNADGALTGVIYEVRNTFGERHSYVAKVEPGQWRASGLRQSRHKRFFVSPLLDMDMRYDFNLKPPSDSVTIRILEEDAQGPILAATFHGTAQPVTSWSLLAEAARLPFLTAKVVGAIHYEALRLWLKGIKLRTRPKAPALYSVDDHPAQRHGHNLGQDKDAGEPRVGPSYEADGPTERRPAA